MSYQLVWEGSATREFDRLPEALQERIYRALARLAVSGDGDVLPVKGSPGLYRLRVGDHRILFEVEDDMIYLVHVVRRNHAY